MQPPSGEKIAAHLNKLLALRDSLTASGVNVAVQQLEGVGVGKVLEQCRTLEADLIVLGTHHHSALYHLFVGSFTSDVLKLAKCPVMVVPASSEAHA
jgi:nucleotide-binding universal stress UspA family protein